jgi:hypothetical protein
MDDRLTYDMAALVQLIDRLSDRLKAAQAQEDPVPSEIPAMLDKLRALAGSIQSRLRATGQDR